MASSAWRRMSFPRSRADGAGIRPAMRARAEVAREVLSALQDLFIDESRSGKAALAMMGMMEDELRLPMVPISAPVAINCARP